MSHKMFGKSIVMCIKSGESDCCTFNDCSLFKQCFPAAYKDWLKTVEKEQKQKR